MPKFRFISPGLHFDNALGGVRVFLSGPDVNRLLQGIGHARKPASDYAGRAIGAQLETILDDLAVGISSNHPKILKPAAAPLATALISQMIVAAATTIQRVNEKNGFQGIVLEVGYPNVWPDVYGPTRWDHKY